MSAPLSLSDDRFPSLQDLPCRYPDARDPTNRFPFLLHQGALLRLIPDQAPEPGAVLVDDSVDPLTLDRWLHRVGSPPIAARLPILAVGSNAYPRQLVDKFQAHPVPDDAVPVLPCTLTDLRLVFCAHLSSHDYPPVTPQQAPGHTTHSWIHWLTPEQLEAVAATEGPAYTLLTASDPGRWLALDHVQSPPRRFAVWWHHAALDLGEGVVVFAGNPAAGLPADPDGLSETVLLHRLVALWMRREGKSLAWDGCSLPPERREAFRRFLYAHARPNPPPSDWTEWDHSAPGLAGPLLADLHGL